jgi:PAS domain-containing protein
MAWRVALLIVIGIATLWHLRALMRQRLLLIDPQRRRFFLRYMQRRREVPSLLATPRSSVEPVAPAAADTAAPAATDSNEAVVYVDASGECTFANQAAHELLQWNVGQLALRQVLAGGRDESEALMDALARRGLVEQHPSTLAGPPYTPLEITAVAVRDRDDNLWGAALFIRRAAGGAALGGRWRRESSQH